MTAVDYGIVLVVLDPHTGAARPLRGPERDAWLAQPGAVATTAPIPPPSGSTLEVPVRLPALPDIAPSDRFLATAALLRTLTDRRFVRLLRLVRAARRPRRRGSGLATADQVASAYAAVQLARRTIPAAVRPIDEAVAVLLVLRAWGLTAAFRYGVTVDPVDVRGWVEVDGDPGSRPPQAARFTPFPPR